MFKAKYVSKKTLFLLLISFSIAGIVGFSSFQHQDQRAVNQINIANNDDPKQQLTSYLEEINSKYKGLNELQFISKKAMDLGMQGNHQEELRVNKELLKKSEDFTAQFKTINPGSGELAKIHQALLRVNDLTHETLKFRVEAQEKVLAAMAANHSNPPKDPYQPYMDEFWAKQNEGSQAFDKFETQLMAYASTFGIDPHKYLPALYAEHP